MTESEEIMIGDIKIAENVLERMARESAARVGGVSQVKSIAITPKEESLSIDLNLVLDHKTVYPEVGKEVQTVVTEDLSRMTGVKIDEVNVMVERLDFSKE